MDEFSFTKKSMLIVMLMAASSGAWADGGRFEGYVVGVTDGDTVTVLDINKKQHEVRLAYIDAPETTCHARKPSAWDDRCVDHGQPFAKQSKKNLSNMVFNQDVVVDVMPGSTYGREIGVIYSKQYVDSVTVNGKRVNATASANFAQVNDGMAWFYRKYAAQQLNAADFSRFNSAEAAAVNGGKGLWSHPGAIPPWDYRHAGEQAYSNQTKNEMMVAFQGVSQVTKTFFFGDRAQEDDQPDGLASNENGLKRKMRM